MKSNQILVSTHHSLISVGTERQTIELGRKSLAGKAAARPDLVRRAISKAKQEGLLKTYREAMGRLDMPTPLGYSSAGVVLEAGIEASGYAPGDRVGCVGQGFASHAEIVAVPTNLSCHLPENVTFEEASFGMLGIIAMHGVRQANLGFGSKVAVVGLGLIGLLTIQILRAYGCEVLAMDVDESKVAVAADLGFENVGAQQRQLDKLTQSISSGFGVDAVLVTANSKVSKSSTRQLIFAALKAGLS